VEKGSQKCGVKIGEGTRKAGKVVQKTQKGGHKKAGKGVQQDILGGAKNTGKKEYRCKKIGKGDVKRQA
jgi:hypothetical protein